MKDTATHKKRNKSVDESAKSSEHHQKDHKEPKAEPTHHRGGRRISQHKKGNHGDHHHHHDHHQHHDHHHDHDHDHHHSTSSHPIRPRRDTIGSRTHSIHKAETDKGSTGTGELMAPMAFYENTYKLTPDCRVHEGKIRNAIRDVLKENITEKKYDPSVCGAKCKLISEIIKERIKHLNMERFKIVSMVMIGQIFDQSMLVTSRCLWDHRFDNQVTVEYKHGDIVAIGLVYAVYAE